MRGNAMPGYLVEGSARRQCSTRATRGSSCIASVWREARPGVEPRPERTQASANSNVPARMPRSATSLALFRFPHSWPRRSRRSLDRAPVDPRLRVAADRHRSISAGHHTLAPFVPVALDLRCLRYLTRLIMTNERRRSASPTRLSDDVSFNIPSLFRGTLRELTGGSLAAS